MWLVLLFGCAEPHTGVVVGEPLLDSGLGDCLAPAIGAIEFGTVTVGQERELTAAWRNECGDDLIIMELSVSGQAFAVGVVDNILVPRQGTLQVPVVFTPSSEGPAEGALHVQVDHVQVSPSDVPLYGTGFAE